MGAAAFDDDGLRRDAAGVLGVVGDHQQGGAGPGAQAGDEVEHFGAQGRAEGGEGLDADIVTWNGRRYTVVTVDDYSRYGAGFTCATCRLLEPR